MRFHPMIPGGSPTHKMDWIMESSSVPYGQAAPTTAQLGSDPETVLATQLPSEFRLTANSSNIADTFWRCVLVHCPVVGWNWPQSSAVHRIWHGVAKSCDSFPSSWSLPLCTNLLFYHFQSTQTIMLPEGIKHCSSIFSFILRLINF